MNEMNKANGRYWDAQAADWERMREADQLWRRCPSEPELAFEGEALDCIRRYVGDLRGKQACVIGSGDNYVAFALAGMGARVTSTDISGRQLEVARRRADALGLAIDFVVADATLLDGIPDGAFDLVCSSNGFFVWIAEPGQVFAQVRRILKPGGFYIFYDIHPFQRPWKNQATPLEMAKPYTMTGPFVDEGQGQASYEFNWRMCDLLNPLLEAGLVLRHLGESSPKDVRFWEGNDYTSGKESKLQDWQSNPRAGLPVWMTVVAGKDLQH